MAVPVPLLPKPVRWLGVTGLAGFIFYTSIVTVPPETAIDSTRPSFAEVAQWRHFLAYGTLAYALAYATAEWDRERWVQAVAVVGVVSLYGASIEIG